MVVVNNCFYEEYYTSARCLSLIIQNSCIDLKCILGINKILHKIRAVQGINYKRNKIETHYRG